MRLTLIGPGNMALALARGLEKEHELTVVGRDGERLLAFTQQLKKHAKTALLEKYDMDGQTVILCVKPHALAEVGKKLKGKADTLYSVLAGVSLETLAKHLKAEHRVRTMPNLAAGHFASMTALTGDPARKEEAITLFNAIGRSLWLQSEKELDIATAVAGSGPAYLAMIAEALADGAVGAGLRRDDAHTLVQGLFNGFPGLLEAQHPALLKERVMSPGGTTAAGCAALEREGVRHAFMEAVKEAFRRARNDG